MKRTMVTTLVLTALLLLLTTVMAVAAEEGKACATGAFDLSGLARKDGYTCLIYKRNKDECWPIIVICHVGDAAADADAGADVMLVLVVLGMG
jgi:hypothetical protein